MASALTLHQTLQDSLSRTRALVRPTTLSAILFIGTVGSLVLGANALPESAMGQALFLGLVIATLFAHSVFSVDMYRAALSLDLSLVGAACKLTLAWMLVIVIAAIGATMIILFFSLIGSSLGVVSGQAGQEITDMAAQMRAGGTFWPLFAVFMFTLLGTYWFAVRLMTFAAATTARGHVHVFRTWYWTKGAFRVLGPAMALLIVMPAIAGLWIGNMLATILFGTPTSPLETAGYAVVMIVTQLPAAWLGHGFAASVYAQLAPEPADHFTTPD